MKRLSIKDIIKKKGKIPITCLTSYSKPISQILDKFCDIILVGDSLGMVLYGLKSTKQVKFETMLLHGKTVRNSTKKSLVVFDMPYNTYSNKFLAYKNAKKVMSITKCDAIKLEGGKKITSIIEYLTKKGIPVMGHIGLLPQFSSKFKLQGKNNKEKNKIIEDAKAITKSGVFAIVLECIVESLAKKITKVTKVPTIGIGASKYCDGQILVTDDIIGLSSFSPRFVKKYSNIKKVIEKSVKKYCDDVKNKRFPSSKNVYKY